jgi:hypothetical protein
MTTPARADGNAGDPLNQQVIPNIEVSSCSWMPLRHLGDSAGGK